MTDFPWDTDNLQTIASANGGAIAALGAVAAPANFDNTVNRDDVAMFEILATPGGAPTPLLDMLDLYLVPIIDGTDVPTTNVSGTPAIPQNCYVGSFQYILASAIPQRMASSEIDILPLLYVPFIWNRTAQTVAVNWSMVAKSWKHGAV